MEDEEKLRRQEDVELVREGIQAALGMPDVAELKGQIDMLREYLQQELAVNLYMSEIVPDGFIPFNDLSLEDRREYFERVSDKI